MASHDPIRITKYSNRRLYDAANSRHLTLDQLVELIKEGHD
ncbi:MAG: polyhydroxyalkanoate synthesis regulator DNA-binding domain-containing protein, partial [Deltaproteobacteria bacterium]|nr:polyhydroxyalkanoate synthesis regulator DNA-binding domain-containing protein [Deltaproteobacteria bacterium]